MCESRDFLLPAIQKWMKAGCFAAVFKLFCCYFQTFLRCFSRILTHFRNFSEFFQIFFRNFWKISEKFVNPEIFCCQRCKNEWKLAVLLLLSNFLRCFSRILTNFRNFSENFQIFFRNFSEISEKILKIFWKISEIFLKKIWIQRFSAVKHSKMKETSCFAAVFKVFS